MCYAAAVLIVVLTMGCSKQERAGAMFQSFERIVDENDFDEFIKILTLETRRELNAGNEGDLSSGFAKYVIGHCAAQSPLRIKDSKIDDGNTLIIQFEGRDVLGKLQYRMEGGQWKIDLVESVQVWKQLIQWSKDVEPFLHRDTGEEIHSQFPVIPGIEFEDVTDRQFQVAGTSGEIDGFTRRKDSVEPVTAK